MANIDDLIRIFRLVDGKTLTTRDVVLLWAVISHPGECGSDIAKRLRIKNRSSVQSNFPRLIERGLIEDRRPRRGSAVPASYYVTDAGRVFWAEIVSGGIDL